MLTVERLVYYCEFCKRHRLTKHVTENADGTITVSPSILVSNPQEGELYHGFLINGEWT